MKKCRALVLSGIAAFVLSPIATGATLGFLKNSPIYYFTDADVKLMTEAAFAALDATEPDAQREWRNEKTGFSGKVQALGDFRSPEGRVCRKLKVWNQAKGIEGEATYPVCKDERGAWRLASGIELSKT